MDRDLISDRDQNHDQQAWPKARSPAGKAWGLIAGLMAIVTVLEFLTPPGYVFGYLYVGPILLASARLTRSATAWVTGLAIALTFLDLCWPHKGWYDGATVANRAITMLALAVTTILSDRSRRDRLALAQQQMRLESLDTISRLREDFASTLTHDLKTPLLGAIATIDAFDRQDFGPVTPSQIKALSVMKQSHRASLHLVETLLDVYRNDADGLQIVLNPVDLGALTEDVARAIEPLAASRQVTLRLEYGASGFRQQLFTLGDRVQLRRVLENLLSNAIAHTPRGSQVLVQLDRHGDRHRVQVWDSGLGIPAAAMPHLFERFYQIGGDRQAAGSGLGLYLCRQIVTAHGGKIWAANRAPRGAIFGFELLAQPLPAGPGPTR